MYTQSIVQWYINEIMHSCVAVVTAVLRSVSTSLFKDLAKWKQVSHGEQQRTKHYYKFLLYYEELNAVLLTVARKTLNNSTQDVGSFTQRYSDTVGSLEIYSTSANPLPH